MRFTYLPCPQPLPHFFLSPLARGHKGYKLICHPATLAILLALLVGFLFIAPAYGVTVKELATPIKDLKASVFGGWMLVVKIAACAAGALFSVFKQGFGPLGIGAGVALGIHFFDTYLGDVSAGALV